MCFLLKPSSVFSVLSSKGDFEALDLPSLVEDGGKNDGRSKAHACFHEKGGSNYYPLKKTV